MSTRKNLISRSRFYIFGFATALIILIWWASLYSSVVQIATALLVLLGIFLSLILPGLLITWLGLIYLVVGVLMLMIGSFVMGIPEKILLLIAFPASLFLTNGRRTIVGDLSWLMANEQHVASFTKNYHPGLNLQRSYNANKIFEKSVSRFGTYPGLTKVCVDVTGIQWAHSEQYHQFNANQYDAVIHAVAGVLKQKRLPSEFLYILDDDMFLILSFRLPRETFTGLTDETKMALSEIMVGDYKPQFQWGHTLITEDNAEKYQTLPDALKHIRREMETDLVTEYMKKESDHD